MTRLTETISVSLNGEEIGTRYVRSNGDGWEWFARGWDAVKILRPVSRGDALHDAVSDIVSEAETRAATKDRRKRKELAK